MKHGLGRHIPLYASADLARESLLSMEGANDRDTRHLSVGGHSPGQLKKGVLVEDSHACRHALGTCQGLGQTPKPTMLAFLRS